MLIFFFLKFSFVEFNPDKSLIWSFILTTNLRCFFAQAFNFSKKFNYDAMLTQLRWFVHRHLFTSRSSPKGFHGDNWLMLPLLKSFSCSWISNQYIKQQDQRPDLLSERKWLSLLKDAWFWQGFSYRLIVPSPLRWCPLRWQMAFGFLPFSESLIASARDSMAAVPRT